MKRILIVNDNLDIGGIQKSLINLLKALQEKEGYDITLLLFSQSGDLLKEVPAGITVITPMNLYQMLGLSREELKKKPLLFLYKAFLKIYAKKFDRRRAVNLLGILQKKIRGYDVAISYSHLTHEKSFSNGCGDFVLDKTVCNHKICFIHCDYIHSGYMSEGNHAEYAEFDKIACCSESVKKRFLEGSKMAPHKVFVVRNFHDPSILELAQDKPYCYDESLLNLVSIARLSKEKGIDRAIDALYRSGRRDLRYYVVGDGPQKEELKRQISALGLEEQIYLLGQQKNPYRFMLHADYLLVPSLHEAAPMVFDEANILGLAVITTNTTSAVEMVGNAGGIVCDNSIDGIKEVFLKLHKGPVKQQGLCNNEKQQKQFFRMIH